MNRIILNETSYHGKGARNAIVPEVQKRGYKKALLCTDPNLVEIGLVNKVSDLLDENNLEYTIFSDIKPNPTIENVQSGVKAYQKEEADYIIALGGGSAIDAAKAIGIIANNPDFEDVRSLEGEANTSNPSVPIIAVATTAGTAAEVTINYVITDDEKQRKFVCVDPHDIPLVAIVDSELMESMPASLAAATGMDALTHAIEGYITQGAWEMSDMFHLKAIELIGQNLRDAVKGNVDAIESMALAQYIAGMGFSNVGLGIAHSMAHTLGAVYDTPHGAACAMMLPIVMEYNQDATEEKYQNIARALGVENIDNLSQTEYRQAAIDAVRQLSIDVGIPTKLPELDEKDLDFLAQSAKDDACTPANPKEADINDYISMFKELM